MKEYRTEATVMLTPNQQLQRIAQGNGPSAELASIKLTQWQGTRQAQQQLAAQQKERVMALRRQRLENCL